MKTILGMSLVEMMLGLALSVMLFSVVIELYLAANKLGNLQNALLFLEENQQVVTNIFRSRVHEVGFIGCAKLTNQFPIISYSPYIFTAANRIENFYSSRMKAGTQGITIRSMNNHTVGLIAIHNDSMLEVSENQHFQNGDILVIADCKRAELFKIKNITTLKNTMQIEPERPIEHSYEPYAEIGQLQIDSYFIGKTTRKSDRGEPIYALYKIDLTGHSDELVEGVNDMQIHYTKYIDHHLETLAELDNSLNLAGISLQLQLSTVGDYQLEKQVVVYVALREI